MIEDKKNIICERVPLVVDRQRVLKALDVQENTEVYIKVSSLYETVLEEVEEYLCPKVLIGIVSEHILCEVRTVGSGIDAYISEAFEKGESMRALLADAIADCALFEMDSMIDALVLSFCKDKAKRIECNLLKDTHRTVLCDRELVKALLASAPESEIDVNQSGMIIPAKSLYNLYELADCVYGDDGSGTTKDLCIQKQAHDCSKCDKQDCRWRKDGKAKMLENEQINIIVYEGEQGFRISCKKGASLMEVLSHFNSRYEAICGGTGKCGKCRVRIDGRELPFTGAERKVFTKKELLSGWHLACMVKIDEPMVVYPDMLDESEIEVIAVETEADKDDDSTYSIAVDIGTTTVAMSLISDCSGLCVKNYIALNHQRQYGADVISRIQSATGKNAMTLQRLILADLNEGIHHLLEGKMSRDLKITSIVISGNTTMLHLFMGYPCDGLGAAPFKPHTLVSECFNIEKLNSIGLSPLVDGFTAEVFDAVSIKLLPGISAFVGADIVSGMTALGMGTDETIDLLIDFGTNGEMAIGNNKKLIVTSTAAGPAFEGGNIVWGTGSIPGAICGAQFEGDKLRVRTIQDKKPIGICGTGLIEIIYELRCRGIIDETGLLSEAYFETGYPVAVSADGQMLRLMQKDIREVQMAKAAICAGVMTLISCYGVKVTQIEHLYIAGGFGARLDYKKAAGIGLIPTGFEGIVESVGNASLYGAVCVARNPQMLTKAENVVKCSQEMNLANSAVFQHYYMEYMYFDKG